MQTRYYIQSGLIVKKTNTQEDIYGLFSLDKFFKKLLSRYAVPYVDGCCTNDPTNLPIRYNRTAAKLQYFSDVTLTWVNLTTF